MENEREQRMSVIGSLMWVCRCCRPGIAYGVSGLQSLLQCAMVEESKLANKLVQHFRGDPDASMVFKTCIPWPSQKGERASSCNCAVSDASQGGEAEILDERSARDNLRSQGAKLTFLSLAHHRPKLCARVPCQLREHSDEQFGQQHDQDRHAQAHWRGRGSGSHPRCYRGCTAKRSDLWRSKGGPLSGKRCLEEKPMAISQPVRCVDTMVLVADCLTNAMRGNLLVGLVNRNRWDLEHSEEARLIKQKESASAQQAGGACGRDHKQRSGLSTCSVPEHLRAGIICRSADASFTSFRKGSVFFQVRRHVAAQCGQMMIPLLFVVPTLP